MPVGGVYDDPERVRRVGRQERKLRRFWVKPDRYRHRCVGFALVAGSVFQPDGKQKLTWGWG